MPLRFLLLHVLLLTTVSCRPSSQNTSADKMLPLGDARPVVESAELSSVDADLVVHAPQDSPHPAPQKHGSQRRRVLQEEMHGDADGVSLRTGQSTNNARGVMPNVGPLCLRRVRVRPPSPTETEIPSRPNAHVAHRRGSSRRSKERPPGRCQLHAERRYAACRRSRFCQACKATRDSVESHHQLSDGESHSRHRRLLPTSSEKGDLHLP